MNARSFESLLKQALLTTSKYLKENDHTVPFSSCPHRKYSDSFKLVKYLTNCLNQTLFKILEFFGITNEVFKLLQKKHKAGQSILLNCTGTIECKLLKKEVINVNTGLFSFFKKSNETVEYTWKIDVNQAIVIVASEETLPCFAQEKTFFKKTSNETPPARACATLEPLEIDISWFLSVFDETQKSRFKINRDSADCYTPRRNRELKSATEFIKRFVVWVQEILQRFSNLFLLLDMEIVIDCSDLPVPLLPLVTEANSANFVEVSQLIEQFLSELNNKIDFYARTLALYALPKSILGLLVALGYCKRLMYHYALFISYVEYLLEKGLCEAIGKVIQVQDIDDYMEYRFGHLTNVNSAPKRLSHVLRSDSSSPAIGSYSVNQIFSDQTLSRNICAFVSQSRQNVRVNLHSSSTLTLKNCDVHVHGYLNYEFAQPHKRLELSCTARPLCEFILMIGTMINNRQFQPQYAFLLSGGAQYQVPLQVSSLPSQKEFEDLTLSLSHEQKSFVEQYRASQIESSMFAFCLIPVQPQLEALLSLPARCLRKQIVLCQKIMKLFSKYHISPELLSYDGPEGSEVNTKIERVKELVFSLDGMIDGMIEEELEEIRKTRTYSITPPPSQNEIGKKKVSAEREAEIVEIASTLSDLNEMFRDLAFLVSEQGCQIDAISSNICSAAISNELNVQNTTVDTMDCNLDNTRKTDQSLKVEALEKDSNTDADITSKPSEININSQNEIKETGPPNNLHLARKLMNDIEKYDKTLRPTTIKVDELGINNGTLTLANLIAEKQKAIDLLDLISRSGSLDVSNASLHILFSATHKFEKTLLKTVIRRNVDPLKRLVKSAEIMAAAIHNKELENFT